MRIGNHELNENEAEWCRTFADEISNFATKKAISSLNKKLDQDDVKGLLKYLWNNNIKEEKFTEAPLEPVSEPEFTTEEDE